ncbi:MAG: cell division protein FtsW [Candidatus Yonathbacteria bacterium]|nr:cell division protein FtsW [Candidatus Yonathbacteria bacterium]
MKKIHSVDKIFLSITALLTLAGLFVFTSASFGLFAHKGFSLKDMFFDQVVLGFFLGIVMLIIMFNIPLKIFRTYALSIFIGAALFTLLVFVPGIGAEHGGAKRWLWLGPTSFQPSEILKLGTIIYFAAILSLLKDRLQTAKYAIGVFFAVIAVPAIILLLEPDNGTLGVLFVAMCAMLLASGAKIRHFFILAAIGIISVGVLALASPHVKARMLTFFNQSRDPQGAGYQIQKSFLAIGSGGITGRGFGQSIQKFGSLPEPTGDSIFAVAAEEFGFIGGAILIVLFLLFGVRGLQIAYRAPDLFSGLLAVGIVILIVSQSFVNIGAMLGVIPLKGIPLIFVSKGGSALIFAFIEIGILLNISKLKI